MNNMTRYLCYVFVTGLVYPSFYPVSPLMEMPLLHYPHYPSHHHRHFKNMLPLLLLLIIILNTIIIVINNTIIITINNTIFIIIIITIIIIIITTFTWATSGASRSAFLCGKNISIITD